LLIRKRKKKRKEKRIKEKREINEKKKLTRVIRFALQILIVPSLDAVHTYYDNFSIEIRKEKREKKREKKTKLNDKHVTCFPSGKVTTTKALITSK
jgi:hypothetical protein